MQAKIKIQAQINSTSEQVWDAWTNPIHIVNWNHATAEWHCPSASNDLQVGGRFSITMASKDGQSSFNFEGVYEEVNYPTALAYSLSDGRKVKAFFEKNNQGVLVTELFDPEDQNPIELQKAGWQGILNNLKAYVEQLNKSNTV